MSWDEIVWYSIEQTKARGIGYHGLMAMEDAIFAAQGSLTGLNGNMLGSGAALAAGAIPVAWQVYVFVTLGAPYKEARELIKAQETSTGFSQGFVMGILGWEWRHILSLFYLHNVIRISVWDEQQNVIRVKNYNLGLLGGYAAGRAMPKDRQKSLVSDLRKAAGQPSKGSWTRNDQISFVIPLAAAFSKRLMK
jgi:hypothetical protein